MITPRSKMEYTVVVLEELLAISEESGIELKYMMKMAISIYNDHLQNGPSLDLVVDNTEDT